MYFYGIYVERTIVILGCTYFSENFLKMTNFYQKWRKLKNHVSKQFENAVSPTNVIFGQINPLGGFTNVMREFFIFCHFGPFLVRTSRLAGSLDFWPFFSQGNCQNTDFNHQNMFWGTLKSQTRHPKMAKIVFEWSNYVF